MTKKRFDYVKPPNYHVDHTSSEESVKVPPIDDTEEPVLEEVVAEIEIEIDDKGTSTRKITVREASKPTRGRVPKLESKQKEIITLYNSGTSLKELAEQFGVSVPCVSNTLKRAGVEVRPRGRQKKD